MNVSETTLFRLTAIISILAMSLLSTRSAWSDYEPAGEARALVIGIDSYRFGQPLKGAVASAREIELALGFGGITEVTTLLDAAADRRSVIRSISELASRSRAG